MKIHAPGREEIKECLRIAGGLPEWFNERGLKRIAADILNEETAVAVLAVLVIRRRQKP